MYPSNPPPAVTAYAHTHPTASWEPLFTPFGDGADECQRETCQKCQNLEPYHGHLNKVAFLTAKFASEMFAPESPERQSAYEWGYLAGLWHDLGKFPEKWQMYLRAKSDIHSDEVSGKVDHSTAGAQHAVNASPILGHLLGYLIAGHHSGLLDGTSNNACQASRLLKEDLPDWGNAPIEITSEAVPALPAYLQREPFSLGLFARMIFSSLVDADFLATEAFMNPAQAKERNLATRGFPRRNLPIDR